MTVTGVESSVPVADNKLEQDSTARVIDWCSSNWKKLVAEIVATFMLVFFGCASCIPIDGINVMPPMYAPMAFAFIVMMNIQIFGHISAAHMNPCISLLAIIWGKMSIVLGIGYFIAQVLGSIGASWVLSNLSPVDFVTDAICVTQPHVRLAEWQAVIIEVLLTGALCLLTSAIWDPVNEKQQEATGIKFGLAVAGLSFAGGPLTGASMNPARTLGPALVSGVWTAHWVYWVGPPLGALLASVYKFVWLETPKQVSKT